MTRITFEKILIENDILWNDLVEIELFNPNYVKTFFGKYPKTIKFFGALGYHWGDNDVRLFVENDDKPFETKIIYFNFEQILNIKKWKEIIMEDKIDTSLYEKGRLECLHCVHNLDCDELFDHCVANFILDDDVVHLKSKEDVL